MAQLLHYPDPFQFFLAISTPSTHPGDMSKTFARKDPKTGLIEIVDVITGCTVAVQRTPFDLFNGHRELLIEHTLPSGEKVLLQKGVDPGLVREGTYERFNQNLVDLLCQRIAEGGKITKICTEPGMPTYTMLSHWRRTNPEINEQIEIARRDRAEHMRDLALETAEQAESNKDPIIADALRVETYKWAAAQDDQRYSPRSKVEATLNTPMQIIVHTGITRGIDNGESKDGPGPRDVTQNVLLEDSGREAASAASPGDAHDN